jgi:hypothetical protein
LIYSNQTLRTFEAMNKNRKPTTTMVGLALLVSLGGLLDPVTVFKQAAPAPRVVFELELPDLKIGPTNQPDFTIPSTNVSQILIHVLNPQADEIDYSQIFPSLNGEATGRIHEIVRSERGKLVRLLLTRWPGFELAPGRNTIEVKAYNHRGQEFYTNFVLRTATENYNQEFPYRVELGKDPTHQVPPELLLLEPEDAVELMPGEKTQTIRIVGEATATTAIERVTVNGNPVPLKRGQQITTRDLGLASKDHIVTFDIAYTVTADMERIVVEAVDTASNRTGLQIPVRTGERAPAIQFRGKMYALVIGISDYRHNVGGLKDLSFADNDARDMAAFLQSPSGGRFPAENIKLLLDKDATRERLLEALTKFIAQPGSDDLLLIFWAGHGGPDPFAPQNLYFFTHDSHVDNMPKTALAMTEFQKLLRQHARVQRLVLLVDTCHSAGVTGSQGEILRGGENNLVNLYLEKLLYREEGKAAITSSDVDETSQEALRWGGGHGVFTHFLLEGMQGQADRNRDRLVTIGELFRFVRYNVRQGTRFRQNPKMIPGTNENLTLAAVVSSASAGAPSGGTRAASQSRTWRPAVQVPPGATNTGARAASRKGSRP